MNSRLDDRCLDFEAEVAPRAGLSFLAGAGDSACDEEQKGEDEATADKMAGCTRGAVTGAGAAAQLPLLAPTNVRDLADAIHCIQPVPQASFAAWADEEKHACMHACLHLANTQGQLSLGVWLRR